MNENWYWIELIGFDNSAKDYGASNFLKRLPRLADGISLLFSSIDFINDHLSTETETLLLPCDCSYGARKFSDERERQNWTNLQLKSLICELHKYGVKVLVSFFNFFTYGENGQTKQTVFCSKHREIWNYDFNGCGTYSVNVLKTLADGRLYEDYLFEKCREVIDYYGFDGMQIADGISSARPTIQNGDFSDDMVNQFYSHPASSRIANKIDAVADNAKRYSVRREKILSEFLYEWISFVSDRWGVFYRKLKEKFVNKTLFFNTVWTCDPFETLFRYGLDYKKVLGDENCILMVEEVSPSRAILSKEDQGGFELNEEIRRQVHYRHMLMQLSLKTCLPNAKQISLTPVNDSFEQWNVLEHAFTELQRAILRRGNNFALKNGKHTRCSDGSFFCLSDSMTSEKWRQIDRLYLHDEVFVRSVVGFTALQSHFQLYGELREYIKTREYTTWEYYKELLSNGLDIGSMASYEELPNIWGPVIAANIQTLAAEEKLALENYKGGPLMILGRTKLKRRADFVFGNEFFSAALYNVKTTSEYSQLQNELVKCEKILNCNVDYRDKFGGIWTHPLKYRRMNKVFLCVFAGGLMKLLRIPADEKAGCKTTALFTEENKLRLIISNDEHHYSIAQIQIYRPFTGVRSLIKGAAYEIAHEGTAFFDRIPPRGMDVVELELT